MVHGLHGNRLYKVMTIIFYNNSAEAERVDKTVYLSAPYTAAGVLRAPADVRTPRIMVQLSGLTPTQGGGLIIDDSGEYVVDSNGDRLIASPVQTRTLNDNLLFKNYAYIEEFARYYFIKSVSIENNKLAVFDLECDVLMSFKSDIYNLECIVARNETEYNLMLSDSKMKFERSMNWTYRPPFKGALDDEDLSQLTASGLPSTYCYLMTGIMPYVITGPESIKHRPRMFHDANSAYILNYAAVEQLYNEFNNPDFLTAFANMYANRPMDGVYALRAYPIDFGNLFNASQLDKDVLYLGTYKTNIEGYLVPSQLDSEFLLWGGKLDFVNEYEWWNYDDTVLIFIPMLGFKEFAPEDVYGYYIRFQYSVNYNTGNATIFVDRNNGASTTWQMFKTFSCKLGVELPLSQSNAIEQGTQAALGLISTAVGAAMGNVGAILGGITAIASNRLQISHSEGDSGPITLIYRNEEVDLLQPFALIGRKNKNEPDNYLHTYGKPLNETYALEDLVNSGFTQVDEVHMDGFATATKIEIDEVASKLKSGVIL